MKTKTKIITGLTALCGVVAATSAFGQVTQIWNGAGDGTNFDSAANYGGTLPVNNNNDTAEFNGVVSGNLNLNYSTGNFASGSGGSGINVVLTSSQLGSVSINNLSGKASPNFAFYNITNNSPSGALNLGNDTVIMNYAARPAGVTHVFANNSTATSTIGAGFHMVAGGGNPFTFDFNGTGNWSVRSYLVSDNTPNNNTTIQVDGPGTLNWFPTNTIGIGTLNSINAIIFNGGTLNLQAPHPKLLAQNITFTNAATFVFNAAPNAAQTLSGVISGPGTMVVSNGTLTLQGASTYTGNTVVAGGELVLAHAETAGTSGPLGKGGQIVFTGGTLGYNVINTFDYSSRFSTAASQAFSIDTAGQNVTLATGLSSTGGSLTKLGSGTLTLSGANVYSGNTTISAGTLLLPGTLTGSGNVTVGNSTTLGVTENGTQLTPGTLTVGTTAGATLQFDAVTSQTTPTIAVGSITAGGPITINVTSGSFVIGQHYPLLSWTSGSAPAVTLGTLTGASGNLSVNGNTIQLNVTGLAYAWSGLNNGNWDTTTANNWKVNGVSQIFANGSTALFDDTATGTTNITVNSAITSAGITFNNNTLPYNVTEANPISGSGGLTKSGNSSATLSGGVNTFTGPTTLKGGTLIAGTLGYGGQPSDIGQSDNTAPSLVFNGGSLQYTGSGAYVDRLFTLGTAGGTIDDEGGLLDLLNTGVIVLSGTGSRSLTLTGTDASGDLLSASLGDNGGPTSLTKGGTGTWILAGNNSYSGVTTISGGTLEVGNGGNTGSLGSGSVVNHGSLVYNNVNNVTNGAVTGVGSVVVNGPGAVVLAGLSSYSGGTTINGGTLQIGNGGAGSINSAVSITDNGTFIDDSTTLIGLGGYLVTINGSGNVIVRPGAFLKSSSGSPYTGWTEIDPGGTFQPSDGNSGTLGSSVVTNNGTLFFTRQDTAVFVFAGQIVGSGQVVKENNNQNTGDITLSGVGNSYTGGTWIKGGGIILGDGATPGAGWLPASVPVIFTNTATAYLNSRYLNFNIEDPTYVVTNNIISAVTDGSSTANSGSVTQQGGNTIALIGNNTYPGGTTISAGVLQIGNGGTTGSVGAGAIADNAELDFNLSSSATYSQVISGSGKIVQLGSGTTTLSGANTYTGQTIVSNGTLVVTGTVAEGGDLYIEGGTLISGGTGLLVTNSVTGQFEQDGGTNMVYLNTSVTQSNTFFNVTGVLVGSGGVLQLVNVGPALHVGQKFTIFSGPVVNGNTITVSGFGFTAQNNLAVDGSVTITAVSAAPTLTATVSGGNLNLSWPSSWTGLHVQVQTNTLAKGLGTNWVTIPGSSAGHTFSAPIIATNPAVFYRLAP